MSKNTGELNLADLNGTEGVSVEAMKPNDTAITKVTTIEIPVQRKEGIKEKIVRTDII